MNLLIALVLFLAVWFIFQASFHPAGTAPTSSGGGSFGKRPVSS